MPARRSQAQGNPHLREQVATLMDGLAVLAQQFIDIGDPKAERLRLRYEASAAQLRSGKRAKVDADDLECALWHLGLGDEARAVGDRGGDLATWIVEPDGSYRLA